MNLYRIQATASRTENGWEGHETLPTFLLDADFLGITSEKHAEQIARFLLDPFHQLNIFVTAVKV